MGVERKKGQGKREFQQRLILVVLKEYAKKYQRIKDGKFRFGGNSRGEKINKKERQQI